MVLFCNNAPNSGLIDYLIFSLKIPFVSCLRRKEKLQCLPLEDPEVSIETLIFIREIIDNLQLNISQDHAPVYFLDLAPKDLLAQHHPELEKQEKRFVEILLKMELALTVTNVSKISVFLCYMKKILLQAAIYNE